MVLGAFGPAPREQGSRAIQLPYINRFDTIWEYEKAFLSHRINFFSYLGPTCPICGSLHCYREISPYWRYAIDLFPGFKKKRIPVARFLCRRQGTTFSLLPVQLIPYFQYTVAAVIGTLFLGLECWRMGQQGFWGAMLGVDPDSLVSPWLVACWLGAVLRGLRRGHGVLGRFYDLGALRNPEGISPWQEAQDYFAALGYRSGARWGPLLQGLLLRFSGATGQFLFGIASQQRARVPLR